MNTELKYLSKWLAVNGLSLNINKCKTMLFGPKSQVSSLSPLIKINNKSLELVKNYKFLGLHIDSSLNWTMHIENVINRVSSRVSLLYKAKNYLNYIDKLNLYNSLIHSLLIKYTFIWGVNITMRTKLFLLQKRCMRIIFDKPFLSHTALLFKKSSILKMEEIYHFESLIIIFKIINNLLPTLDLSMISLQNSALHSLRNSSVIIKPFRYSSAFGQKNPLFRGLQFYNKLPAKLVWYSQQPEVGSEQPEVESGRPEVESGQPEVE